MGPNVRERAHARRDIMQAMVAARSSPDAAAPELEGEKTIVVHNVTYAQYVAAREALETPGLRMTYCRGTLELISPSGDHERIKSMLSRMIELFALECDVPLYAYGSTTFRSEAVERGLEPDACYFVGGDLDEETRPYPDIAVEVAISSGGLKKLVVYGGLAVQEVWFWTKVGLQLFALRAGGTYEQIPRSELVPTLDIELLERFATRRDQHAALKEFRSLLARPSSASR